MAPSTANVITSTSPNIQSGDLGVQIVIGSLSIAYLLNVIHSHVYSSLARWNRQFPSAPCLKPMPACHFRDCSTMPRQRVWYERALLSSLIRASFTSLQHQVVDCRCSPRQLDSDTSLSQA